MSKVEAIYYPGEACPEVFMRYDVETERREAGITTDKETMAFSSKTTYTLYQKQQLYSHQTQNALGKEQGAWFKLSKTIT